MELQSPALQADSLLTEPPQPQFWLLSRKTKMVSRSSYSCLAVSRCSCQLQQACVPQFARVPTMPCCLTLGSYRTSVFLALKTTRGLKSLLNTSPSHCLLSLARGWEGLVPGFAANSGLPPSQATPRKASRQALKWPGPWGFPLLPPAPGTWAHGEQSPACLADVPTSPPPGSPRRGGHPEQPHSPHGATAHQAAAHHVPPLPGARLMPRHGARHRLLEGLRLSSMGRGVQAWAGGPGGTRPLPQAPVWPPPLTGSA